MLPFLLLVIFGPLPPLAPFLFVIGWSSVLPIMRNLSVHWTGALWMLPVLTRRCSCHSPPVASLLGGGLVRHGLTCADRCFLVLFVSAMLIFIASGSVHLRAAARGRRWRVVVALWRRCVVPAMRTLLGDVVAGLEIGLLWLFLLLLLRPVPWARGCRRTSWATRSRGACRWHIGGSFHR